MIPEEEEQTQRRWNVLQAFHKAKREGQTSHPFSYDLAEKWIQGDITLDQWLAETQKGNGITYDTKSNN